jgi:hypothetical protein
MTRGEIKYTQANKGLISKSRPQHLATLKFQAKPQHIVFFAQYKIHLKAQSVVVNTDKHLKTRYIMVLIGLDLRLVQ